MLCFVENRRNFLKFLMFIISKDVKYFIQWLRQNIFTAFKYFLFSGQRQSKLCNLWGDNQHSMFHSTFHLLEDQYKWTYNRKTWYSWWSNQRCEWSSCIWRREYPRMSSGSIWWWNDQDGFCSVGGKSFEQVSWGENTETKTPSQGGSCHQS